MQQRLTRYLTFGLAFCTVASNVAYLVYLRSHSMVRAWSGINAVLLGLFFFGWALLMLKRKGRSPALAIGLIGALNLAAGVLFFSRGRCQAPINRACACRSAGPPG